jgi:hypothetical protein
MSTILVTLNSGNLPYYQKSNFVFFSSLNKKESVAQDQSRREIESPANCRMGID